MNTATPNIQKLNDWFHHLWQAYTALNPRILALKEAFIKAGESPKNDHIAFRTLAHPKVNLSTLCGLLKPFGYEVKDHYEFNAKKLDAVHLEHSDDTSQPKIFISELRYLELPEECSQALLACLDRIEDSQIRGPEVFYSGRHWPIEEKTHQQLATHSEYAAWWYLFGYTANHFTIDVNQLKHFKQLSELNQWIEQQGFELNHDGGTIKGSAEVFLEQSSTLADPTEIQFDHPPGAKKSLPSVFYEFAQRHPLPDGQRFEGFVANNADKIFSSTNIRS